MSSEKPQTSSLFLPASAATGLLFGIGLSISGMANPARVLGFLDVTGEWDPTLAFVMIGALMISIPAFWIVKGMKKPVFNSRFFLPEKKDLDARLLSGAAIFGLGWGLVGLCPGPALVALSTLNTDVIIFVIAMLAGFMSHKYIFETNTRA